ncbi:OFCC1 protein, partial [Amia calva]|nr:OFCC1 protein [Amia calva]
EEERAAAEGIENPAFNISSTDLSAYQASEEREIRRDRQDSTLAAHQRKNGLRAHAKPRGNERTRNYFDLPLDEEINPRQCGTEVSAEDELELKMVREDAQAFYKKLSKILEDNDTTVIDLPGNILCECTGNAISLRQTVEDEVIPCYVEQLKECVQADMIALGSLSLEQVRVKKGITMSLRLS